MGLILEVSCEGETVLRRGQERLTIVGLEGSRSSEWMATSIGVPLRTGWALGSDLNALVIVADLGGLTSGGDSPCLC